MLVTLDDMKTYLGIALTETEYDAFLTSQLIMISDAVEGYCGRVFTPTTWTQTYHSDEVVEGDTHELTLYHYPVIAISAVAELTGSLSQAITEYRLHKPTGILKRLSDYVPTYWFGSARAIEVEYEAGYATLPPVIDQVVKSLVGTAYAKETSGIGLDFGSDVQSISIPSTLTIQFDYTLQANERTSKYGMLIGNYANVLDSFRSDREVVGTVGGAYVE